MFRLRRPPDVTFGMIVRNGSRCLRSCLESVAGLCDEMVVVDTGSDDDSRDVARSFGATVIDVPWTDDFAAARNVYVERARCAWILSLDADELLGRLSKPALTEALERHPGTAFVFDVRNYFFEGDLPPFVLPSRIGRDAPAGVQCVISRTVRLFPKRPGLRYAHPVHESLRPAIAHAGTHVRRCHVPIHHLGSLDRRHTESAKAALYGRLGRKKIALHPDHFLGYLELGQVCLSEGDLDEAARLFARAVALRPNCIEAWCFLAFVRLRQGNLEESGRLLDAVTDRATASVDVRHMRGLLEAARRASPDNQNTRTPEAI